MSKTCFVIMPIGDQNINGLKLEKIELKKKYDDLIKEAILKAYPNLEINRSDEVSKLGSISTDILTRIMFSDFVIADITYPNPNVFYELGLRHACRSGTILIKEKGDTKIPFDLAHLKYIEYENTGTGLKELSNNFKEHFDWLENDPNALDNQFLELAKIVKFPYPKFDVQSNQNSFMIKIMAEMLKSQERDKFIEIFTNSSMDQEQKGIEIIKLITSDEQLSSSFFSGFLNLDSNK